MCGWQKRLIVRGVQPTNESCATGLLPRWHTALCTSQLLDLNPRVQPVSPPKSSAENPRKGECRGKESADKRLYPSSLKTKKTPAGRSLAGVFNAPPAPTILPQAGWARRPEWGRSCGCACCIHAERNAEYEEFTFDEIEVVYNRPMNVWFDATCRQYLNPEAPEEEQARLPRPRGSASRVAILSAGSPSYIFSGEGQEYPG